MNWQLLVIVCTCAAVVVHAHGLPNQHKIQTRNARLCGRHLVEALAVVCHSIYYTPNTGKRAGSDLISNQVELEPWWYAPQEFEPRPEEGFLDNRNALSLFGKRDVFYRQMRGVADECCRKGCSISELGAYCGPHSKRK
ncbi:insulin-like [Tachypleus tridentatus]|uniref:insulin-like n=1 Tax=Tachypleus tridentatus TaxID=6853 RepID=UPI003FD24BF2